ncbi:MAG: glycosyltransferase family 4 protein [Acidimicrobiales bacterium]
MTADLLVVAPHATRSGSTRVLLDLLCSDQRPEGLDVALELASGGAMEDELRTVARAPEAGEGAPVVLANSAVAAGALLEVAPGTATVAYVHETHRVLVGLRPASIDGLRSADLVLCVSEGVADGAAALGVDPGRIEVLPPVFRPAPPADAEAVAAIRAELAPDGPLVVACGEARWVKGADLFLELAAALRHEPPVAMVWIGRRQRGFVRLLDVVRRTLGPDGEVTWYGEVDDVAPYLAAADALVVPSREEAQPLVPLEAAAQGTPTACFEVGGLAELVADGAAVGAPYPDVYALAGALAPLLDGSGAGVALVEAARGRAAARQAPEVVGRRFWEVVGGLGMLRTS